MNQSPESKLTLPASNQPVTVPIPPPQESDERMQPFYKKKGFKWLVIILIGAALAYHFFMKPSPAAVVEESATVLPAYLGGNLEQIRVPSIENFDVGGDYDAL